MAFEFNDSAAVANGISRVEILFLFYIGVDDDTGVVAAATVFLVIGHFDGLGGLGEEL